MARDLSTKKAVERLPQLTDQNHFNLKERIMTFLISLQNIIATVFSNKYQDLASGFQSVQSGETAKLTHLSSTPVFIVTTICTSQNTTHVVLQPKVAFSITLASAAQILLLLGLAPLVLNYRCTGLPHGEPTSTLSTAWEFLNSQIGRAHV